MFVGRRTLIVRSLPLGHRFFDRAKQQLPDNTIRSSPDEFTLPNPRFVYAHWLVAAYVRTWRVAQYSPVRVLYHVDRSTQPQPYAVFPSV